ncbi:ATPase family associated with various cellular activities (AAA) [Cnuella takakiae]|uniref:ATPase family associated with various cellular activities (AAA) n=1 Tax=Cnuella takakiae TaxID=1302690 RepID=A0A1M4ZFA3_9BACT|nr:ATP-binding protein [Cnuella takakiae]OLY94232.1 hypothetical protein BUE76_21855 [Cnuella takakiae]SHF16472.1 ATPase family associated with various cellular activities (AAA) [Cnuella takakiae]
MNKQREASGESSRKTNVTLTTTNMTDSGFMNLFQQELQAAFPDLYEEANDYEAIGLTLLLAPVLRPDLLDGAIRERFGAEGDFPLVGGVRGTQHRGVMPTGETWLYACCGDDTARRIDFVQSIPAYLSQTNALLSLEPAPAGEPFLAGRLIFSPYFRKRHSLQALIFEQRLSHLSLGSFMESALQLSDLVLSESVLQGVEEILHWQRFAETAAGDLPFRRRLHKGLKVMFFGKPGTGKTGTVAILGSRLNKRVYRIDLSQVVSKYIGETEKNLSRIFDAAESRGWILFFDEGDALFGKRTAVNSSNDRYANQEVAYLLQRMEDYTGIIIVSTNFRDNVDAAFLRRFQVVVEFSLPDRDERRAIWQKLLAELPGYPINLSEGDWDELSRMELSGGGITNVVGYALLKAHYRQTGLDFLLIKEGIVRELRKENRLTSL